MYCAGLTDARNQFHIAGHYALERQSEEALLSSEAMLCNLANIIATILPDTMRDRDRHVRDVLRCGDASFGMTNFSYTEGFHNIYHCDGSDAPGGAILWFQKQDPAQDPLRTNGPFLMPFLKVYMTPMHGSFLWFNAKTGLHGTTASHTGQHVQALY